MQEKDSPMPPLPPQKNSQQNYILSLICKMLEGRGASSCLPSASLFIYLLTKLSMGPASNRKHQLVSPFQGLSWTLVHGEGKSINLYLPTYLPIIYLLSTFLPTYLPNRMGKAFRILSTREFAGRIITNI